MKKFLIPVGVISLSVIVFAGCHSKKKAMMSKQPMLQQILLL